MPEPTPQQSRAIEANGDVLVMAGAGAGKTSTLVARILDRVLALDRPVPLERLLVVTFTEAAANEMRHRLRISLEAAVAAGKASIAEQLATLETARVTTIHAFCLRLLRDHFHELGLDPQFAVQDELQAEVMRREVLARVLRDHYDGRAPNQERVRPFLERHAPENDFTLSALILRIHDHARSLPEPERWLAEQRRIHEDPHPTTWRAWLHGGVIGWAEEWLGYTRELAYTDPANFAAVESADALEWLMNWRPPAPEITPEPPTRDDDADEDSEDGSQLTLPLFAAPPQTEPAPPRRPAIGPQEVLEIVGALDRILTAGEKSRFRRGTIGRWRKPLERLFDQAAELRSLLVPAQPDDPNPLEEDWEWARVDVLALLELVNQFTDAFTSARRAAAVVDFADLEQLALRLLWDPAAQAPTALARQWRERLDLVFVDECQDINGAQDRILACLSRTGPAANRFFVGDVKQSIYRFRRADPRIFQEYARRWRTARHGCVVPLTDNFRSHERILEFVNAVFSELMRTEIGGLEYDADARLAFGAPEQRAALRANPAGRIELLLCLKDPTDTDPAAEPDSDDEPIPAEDLDAEELQATAVAERFRELHEQGHPVWDAAAGQFRPVTWRDMVVLHPSPRPVAERWARSFSRRGIPLEARRTGFFEALEVADLINLLRILDNPRQDHPLLAVLHSPIVGLDVNEMATVRIANTNIPLWDAIDYLVRSQARLPATHPLIADPELRAIADSARSRLVRFLQQFERWRRMAREGSLADCLEVLLAESGYETWLRAQPRAEARLANVRKLLTLSSEFDQFQRHGLFRFIQFLEAQSAIDRDPENAPAAATDCVRLISIHQSKGLEFPIVAVAGIGRPFNLRDVHAEWLLDEEYGICPPVLPPQRARGYHSLPRWMAEFRQRREFIAEQIRLLYVACTRAADRLFLAACTRTATPPKWSDPSARLSNRAIIRATSPLAWLGPLIPRLTGQANWHQMEIGSGALMDWRIRSARPIGFPIPCPATEAEPAAVPQAALDSASREIIREKLRWRYPWTMATRKPAKSAVTRLTRSWRADEEAAPSPVIPRRRDLSSGTGSAEAIERGAAHHLFCELVDLSAIGTRDGLSAEAARLTQAGLLLPDQVARLDLDGLWAFWDSAVGRAIRAHAEFVERELPFTVRLSLEDAERLRAQLTSGPAGFAPDDFKVIQGVIDLAVLLEDEIWIVDFKTDRLSEEEVDARAHEYRFQLRLYAHALTRIYNRPVTQAWLYFVAARRAVPDAMGSGPYF